jgi:cytochrome d ubiquinol oxidase subunit I
MWTAATGTLLSAYFILTANAWMQHPVGSAYNPATNQDELRSFAEVIFNPAQLAGFPHVIAGCFVTAGGLVAGVALWQLLRPGLSGQHALAFRHALKAGAIATVAGFAATLVTGDIQGKLFTQHYQPMKMAAAEALYHTSAPAPFSLLTIGSLNGSRAVFEITLPRLLSFLGTGNWSRSVQGIDNLQAQYAAQYGPGSYVPDVPVTYWSFRLMIGAGMLAALIAIVALWVTRRGRVPARGKTGRWRKTLAFGAVILPLLPLAGNSMGWIMTEMGRQPWIVYGQMKTSAGVSANSAGEVLASLVVFTLLYGALAVIEAGLMLKSIRGGLTSEPLPGEGGGSDLDAGGAGATTQLLY